MSEIMKKIKHGEFSKVADKTPPRGKLDSSIMKEYKHGEFSGAGGKAANAKPASWSTTKIKQGSFNN